MSCLRQKDGGILLNLRVSPGAKITAIKEDCGKETLKISVTAPPAGGKDNHGLIKFLASTLGVRPSAASVVRGAYGRDRVVFVEGLDARAARWRLHSLSG